MISIPRRHGVTVPIAGVPLSEHRELYEELESLGYTDIWSSEANMHDAFTPLALAAAWAPSLRLGTAIVPVYTRGPATLAQSVAALCDAAPGRFVLGIGASSPAIVQDWNAIPYEKPYARVRDTLRFLRAALTGEKVTAEYETFSVRGLRLEAPPKIPPSILVAALRPGMLRLAGEEGDGAILNWLSADDVARVAPYVGDDKEIMARLFVVPYGGLRSGAHLRGTDDRGVPERSGLPHVPRVARTRHAAPADVGRLGSRGSQTRHRSGPRRGGRRTSSSGDRPTRSDPASSATARTASPHRRPPSWRARTTPAR